MMGCKLKFTKHYFPNGKFCEAFAECTRKGSVQCNMKYCFSIEIEPLPNNVVKIYVEPTGTLHHDISSVSKRRFAGIRRQEVKEQLKNVSASILRRKLFSDPTTVKPALDRSNYTQVQSLNVLRKARFEIQQADELDKDILQDLIKRSERFRADSRLTGDQCKGFIQELSVNPFYVSFYEQRQLNLLKRYLEYSPSGTLHFDSTGKVTAKLPDVLGEKQSYYYAVVIQLPGGEESPCIPVLQFITNQHFAANTAHILHYFFRRFSEVTANDQIAFGIKRMETDCSRALISTVLQALEIGRTERYLKDAWHCLAKNQKLYYVHHICRYHSSRFIGDHIRNQFSEADRPNILKWMERFLFSNNLNDYCRRVKDIIIICGKKYYTKEVKETLGRLSECTRNDGTNPWSATHLEELPDSGRFYSMSPFSNYAIKLCHELNVPNMKTMYKAVGKSVRHDQDDEDDAEDAEYVKNPTYCTTFLQYLIKQVFSLGCMYNHSLLHLNGYTTAVDTNAVSESWNKILKNDEMKHGLGIKIGKFISFSEEMLQGRLEMFEQGLSRMERRKVPQRAPASIRRDESSSEDEHVVNPESSTERWSSKRQQQGRRVKLPSSILGVTLLLSEFGYETPDGYLDATPLINIDNVLQIIYSLFKLNESTNQFLTNAERCEEVSASILLQSFAMIDSGNFNEAKRLVVEQFLHFSLEHLSEESFINSEIFFIRAMSQLFPINVVSNCSKLCPMAQKRVIYPLRDVLVRNYQIIPSLLSRRKFQELCEFCNKKNGFIEHSWSGCGALPLICYAIDVENYEMFASQIPSSFGIIGSGFTLFAFTYLWNRQFFTIFYESGKKFLFNGKEVKEVKEIPQGHRVSTVWYIAK